MGHEFGLHYDANLLKNNLGLNIKKNLIKQIDLFENFYHCKISAISCHRPKKYYEKIKIKSVINVYDASFHKEIKYFSDSQQRYRENIDSIIDSNQNLHFLVHDYTWSRHGNTWQKNIKDFFNYENFKLRKYYLDTIDQWNIGLAMRKTKDVNFKKKILNK